MGMAKKKRKPAPEEKKPIGRPKVLPPELDTRKQIRCASVDFAKWEERAFEMGFPDVSAWIRKVANDALKQPGR